MFKSLLEVLRKDNPLQQAQELAFEMLEKCSRMFNESVNRLRNPAKANENYDIRAEDKAVNKLEREIRRKIVTHLTVGYVRDLNTGLILSSTIIDMERVGDYTKNVADLSRLYREKLNGGPLEESLQEIEKTVRAAFKDITRVLKRANVERARSIMAECTSATKACDKAVNAIIQGKVSDFSTQQAAAVALYFRYLKRIASHLHNIATSVVNPFARIGFREKKKRG